MLGFPPVKKVRKDPKPEKGGSSLSLSVLWLLAYLLAGRVGLGVRAPLPLRRRATPVSLTHSHSHALSLTLSLLLRAKLHRSGSAPKRPRPSLVVESRGFRVFIPADC